MEAKKIPEKIQIHFIRNDYDDWSVRGYSFLEDKQIGMTEYIRTDVFIEKACNFIDERLNFDDNAWYIEGEVTVKDKVIEDFKNYMKEG